MEDININETLKTLQDLYLKGEYQKYRDLLLSSKEKIPAQLFHYNLGTAYGKEGQYPAARYNLEKAKSLGFEHPALIKNLNTVKIKIEGNSIENEGFNYLSFMTNTSSSLFLTLALIGILISALFKKLKWINYKVFVLMSLILILPFIYKEIVIKNKYSVGINLKDTKIYEGPSEIYGVVKELTGGHKVIVGKKFNDWVMIESPEENIGWIKYKDLAVL